MTAPLPFTEEHRDCLQEICNVAMGAAGESLAAFANVFVNLSIPKIRYIAPKELAEALESLQGGDNVSGVVQRFGLDERDSYSLIVITEPSFHDLASSAGRSLQTEEDSIELLKELSELVNKTCLSRLAETMENTLSLQAPEVLALHVPLNEMSLDDIATSDRVVSVEINYHLEHHPFNCDLLLLLPDAVVNPLVDALESLLAD